MPPQHLSSLLCVIIILLIAIMGILMYIPYTGTTEEILAEKEKRMKISVIIGLIICVSLILIILNMVCNSWQLYKQQTIKRVLNTDCIYTISVRRGKPQKTAFQENIYI